ncbi:hypothetical protein [Qingshengfaniella alkalisoli]|uniref:Capsular polysaccharide transport system permease protein n=1 Tax=Qingshengfaniella alkalisoli TaxID=2599296 RepID=A0A5B8IYW6_9RHOB|nr:hypothetical protein [Qingshengfaniella alkalisoli]QDY70101.1 hypothetical protein FPZ52_11035 [Qingshengfaniella alkalisoli]
MAEPSKEPTSAEGQKPQAPKSATAKPAAAQKGPASVVKLRNAASRAVPKATVKRRHKFLGLSFVVMVLLPALLTIGYLWLRAEDRYASTTAFSVRTEDTGSALESFAGIPALGVSPMNTPDSDILYQFIQSQRMVEIIDQDVDLRSMFNVHHDQDPVFALDPSASLEDLVDYWSRIVSIIYEPDNGLMTLEVQAFNPQDAQRIGQAILEESSSLINELSQIARDDTIRLAQEELDKAAVRLKETRLELSRFRDIEQIVDPTADLAGQMGVIGALQQSLAEAMIRRDTLVGTTENPNDPRIVQADRTIEAIKARILDERENIGAAQVGAKENDPLSRIVGEYEGLLVDREFAEKSYLAALASYDSAVAEARRQSRYLAVHIQPTQAESAIYPRRVTLTILVSVMAFLIWTLFVLVAYSIRDRR